MNYSLYFHIPFCTHRCAYCDFNTYAGQEALIPAYSHSLTTEIQLVSRSAGEKLPVHTLFFGGGTPSLLSPEQFDPILAAVRSSFELVPVEGSDSAEVTLEANPGTISRDALNGLRRVGFNRVSFGVQSTQPEELRQLERIHNFFDVIDSVKWARQAGFENLNLDLIYALPAQRLSRWQDTLRRAVALQPEHLSLYALTLEMGTPFGRWAGRGLLPMPDPDLAADMYEWASDFLASEGYEQYEISNWSRPGFQCRHNLQYWRNLPYLGLGAGAHGYARGIRYSNVLRIKTYIERLPAAPPVTPGFPLSPAVVDHHRVTRRDEMGETMITGLRLTCEGVSASAFQARFGASLDEFYGNEILELTSQGLLERQDGILRLTRRGRLLGNRVFIRFI